MHRKFQIKGPRNNHNSEIYYKVLEMKQRADDSHNKHASFAYGKVIKSLEKYPMPILTLKQASGIEGIGSKMLQVVYQVVNQKYEKYKKTEDQPPQKTAISDFFTKKQINPVENQGSKKEKVEKPKQKEPEGEKNVLIKQKTSKYHFLTTLYQQMT